MKWKPNVHIGGPALFKQQNSRYLSKSGLHNTDDILGQFMQKCWKVTKIHRPLSTTVYPFKIFEFCMVLLSYSILLIPSKSFQNLLYAQTDALIINKSHAFKV